MACWAAARTCPTLLRCEPGPAIASATRYNCPAGIQAAIGAAANPAGRPSWL